MCDVIKKAIVDPSTGLDVVPPLNDKLFPFQKDIVAWALKRGRAAIFELLSIDDAIRRLIRPDVSAEVIAQAARRAGLTR